MMATEDGEFASIREGVNAFVHRAEEDVREHFEDVSHRTEGTGSSPAELQQSSPAGTSPTETASVSSSLQSRHGLESSDLEAPSTSAASAESVSPLGLATPPIDLAADADEATLPYNVMIYDQLNSLFGTSSEVMVMEFPGRVLDPSTYAYPVTGPYSALVKPQVVSEAEFRLTDALFDFDPAKVGTTGYRALCNGPTAVQLSTAYEAALNALVPVVTDAEVAYSQDKERIRAWLAEPVSAALSGVEPAAGDPQGGDTAAAATSQVSRMSVYEQKYAAYTAALEAWRNTKEQLFQQALADTQDQAAALDVYARKMAEQSQSHEAAIAAVWDDLVARGYYHEIREALGFLDVSTPGELLDQAKAAMRQSGLSSLDETETIYPVQLQPTDWFTSLTSDFSPIDLLLDPDAMRATITSLQDQLDDVNTQIAMALSNRTGDPKQLQAQVDAQRSALDDAMTSLTNVYTQNTITAVKMYLAANPGGKVADAASEIKRKDQSSITPADLDDIQKGLNAANAAQQQLTEAAGKLSELMSQKAEAEVTQSAATLSALQSRADGLRSRIAALTTTLDSPQAATALQAAFQPDALKDTTGKAKMFDPKKLPAMQQVPTASGTQPPAAALLPSQVQGNWMTAIIHANGSAQATSTQLSSSSTTTNYDVDLFFGSASGSSTQSSAKDTADSALSNWDISIGMLATKVTIDRGGWFQPGTFATPENFATLFPVAAQLPGYPTAFVVVKDVTIILSKATSSTASADSVASSAQSNSGGFLCFSVSGSSSSHDESHSSSAASNGASVVIRIPQPQILAWMVTPVAYSQSSKASTTPFQQYTALPADYPAASSTPPAPALDAAAVAVDQPSIDAATFALATNGQAVPTGL